MTPADDLRIRNAWVRGSNPLCGTKKINKSIHLRDAGVLARGFAVATFVPAQCVGRDCESSLRHHNKLVKANTYATLVFSRVISLWPHLCRTVRGSGPRILFARHP